MVTPDRVHTYQATERLPLSIAPTQAGDAQNISRVTRDAHTTRNSPLSYPRIPRLVSKSAKSTMSSLDSQFQVNASHVQKRFSLNNETAEKSSLVSAARRRRDASEKPSVVASSSSSERYASSVSIPNSLKHKKSRKRDRRASSPTDSDDEDPFHFDNILSSSPTKQEASSPSPSRALSSSLLRRASIVPVDPAAEPAPHRFSLLRERASEETIFVQEICDADGRRWSLRVPASGLPEDMVHMLEELEKLAVELGQALPRIVVTCSAESLSMVRMERETPVCSSELLRPPPAVGDASSVGYDAGTGLSLAKEKHRIADPGHGSEEPARPAEPSSVAVSSASENSLMCIYLPELAPEFLSGSSTSPVLQPADGFHSKPAAPVPAAQAIQCPRQRAFFSALKEPQPASSSIAKRLIMPHSTKAELESRRANEAVPSCPTTPPPARSKSRTQAAKSKSALPILKSSLKSASQVAATDDRRRARWASLSKSPAPAPQQQQQQQQPEGLRAHSSAAPEQQRQRQPSGASSDHPLHTKTSKGVCVAMTLVPSGAGADAGAITTSALQHQHTSAAAATAAPAISSPPVPSPSQPPDRTSHPSAADAVATAPRAVSAPAPATGRKLRHLFRRPPVRSASDPPLYSYSALRPVADGAGMKRPASEVGSAPRREVVERSRMPRLPSARDLLRKLT